MANRAVPAILALAATVTLSGCGTIGNLAGNDDSMGRLSPEARVYGGVAADMGAFKEFLRPRSYLPWLYPVLASFALLDLPLSAVGDTLTLPLAVYAEWKRYSAEASRFTPPADGPPGGHGSRQAQFVVEPDRSYHGSPIRRNADQ